MKQIILLLLLFVSACLQAQQINVPTTPGGGTNLLGTQTIVVAGDSAAIRTNSITTSLIQNGAVTAAKLGQSSATNGQVFKWNGSAWAPANESGGVTDGDKVDIDVTSSGLVWTVDTSAISTIKIAANAIDSTKLAAASVQSSDIGTGAVWRVNVASNAIDSTKILTRSVQSSDIGVGAVWNTNLAANAVDSSKILTRAVQSSDIGIGSVWRTNLAALAVDSSKLAVSGVTVTRIANGAVWPTKINQAGATSGQVLKWNGSAWAPAADAGGVPDGDKGDIDVTSSGTVWTVDTSAVTTVKIAANAVDSSKIAASGVTVTRIANGAVWPVKINQAGATSGQVMKWNGSAWAPANETGGVPDGDKGDITVSASGATWTIDNSAVTTAKIAADAIDSTKIAARAVQSSDIEIGGVWNTNLADNSVDSTKIIAVQSSDIANGAVWRVNIANSAIDSTKLAPAAVQSSDIGSGSVWRVNIANSAIDSTKILARTVQSSDIGIGSVWRTNLAALAVDSSKIAASGVTVTKIANGAVWPVKINQAGATSGQVLRWSGSAWAPATPTATPTGSATGDLGGTYPSPTVVGIQGRGVTTGAPSSGWTLIYNGSQWAPAAIPAATLLGDVTGNTNSTTVEKIRGVNITATTPTTNQVLKYNGTAWAPAAESSLADGDKGDITVTASGATWTIDNGVVSLAKLASASVDSTKIISVQSSDISPGAVWRVNIANAAIDSTKLAAAAVQSSDIGTGAVWATNVAANAIDSTKIRAGTIANSDLNGGITLSKLGQSGATNGQIAKWNGSAWAPAAESATASLQAVTNVGYITTRSIRTDSLLRVRGTEASSCGIEINNTTASTGVNWTLNGKNNGRLELNRNATLRTFWAGSNFNQIGSGYFGSGALSSISEARLISIDSTTTTNASAVQNKGTGNASFIARSATGTSDALLQFTSGATSAYIGSDQSDSSSVKIGVNSTSVGTNSRIRVSTGGVSIGLNPTAPTLGAELDVQGDVKLSKIIVSSPKPTASYVNVSGTSGTATVNYGGDMAFNLSFQSGSVPNLNDYILITFAFELPATTLPIVGILAADGTASNYTYRVDNATKSTTSFRIYRVGGTTTSSCNIDVHVICGQQ